VSALADWFGASWTTVGFVVLSTVAIYLTTFAAVRLAGRRSLSQLSAFDAVVTVAIGSTLASTALDARPAYAHGATVIATLLCVQVGIAALRQRWPVARRVLDFPAELVVRDGKMDLPTSPMSSQLSEDELRSLLRRQGIHRMEDLRRVLLEPSGGAISVVADDDPPDALGPTAVT
jgi:uncharacterized membrane protein YcaP (DUF421 family)